MKICKKNKKKILYCLLFIVYLLFLIIVVHCFDFLGNGKQSWSEILHDLWLYCIGAMAATVVSILKDNSNDE